MTDPQGLGSRVPDSLKRQVRQACGFGCVVCGGLIIQYEDIDPAISETTAYEANAMALLCPGCHAEFTSGAMAKEAVAAARAAPYCRRVGCASAFVEIGRGVPSLVFGGVKLVNCPTPIMFQGVPVFTVKQAEADGAPFRLSGDFYNAYGVESLKIVDNEWRALASNWEVEVSGGAITIRDSPAHITLRLVADPPSGLIVEQIDMQVRQSRFIGGPDRLILKQPSGGEAQFTGGMASDCRVGLTIG